MKEFIGIRTPTSFGWHPSLKRDALIFDKVAIFNIADVFTTLVGREHLISHNKEDVDFFTQEVRWLIDKEMVFELISNVDAHKLDEEGLMSNEHYAKEYAKFKTIGDRLHEMTLTDWKKSEAAKKVGLPSPQLPKDYLTLVEQQGFLWARLEALRLRLTQQIDACPIVSKPLVIPALPAIESEKSSRSDVIQIAVKTIPVPSESVSWEQILEYRSDPDSKSKFLALRHWMSEVARAELTPAEVEEKLEYLIDQYQRHMKLHRMKTNVGTLETVVTTGAEFFGNLASFQWGKAAQALFSLKKREVALQEAELSAPGKEIAYIVKTRETFAGE